MFFDYLTMCPAGLHKLDLVTLLESAYLWQAGHKESFKKCLYLGINPEHHQNLFRCPLCHYQRLLKTLFKSIPNFLK